MSMYRADRPDAPVRVRKSALRPGTWLWRCMDTPAHHGHGYPGWDDAFTAAEKHRRTEHGTDSLQVVAQRIRNTEKEVGPIT